jgi:steroid 5-alpha reductase family enzyme
MPWVIVLCAVLFNLMNAGLNGHWLAEFAPTYGDAWLRSPSFIAGLALFALGAWINVKSDNMLIALRAPGETGYKIPRGFLFNYVSAPNLFGEMVEWAGFALMAWNWPALSFLVWTVANLLPRAVAHHAWYRARFADYPPERKAVVPWVW